MTKPLIGAIPAPAAPHIACVSCGVPTPGPTPPYTWSKAVENGHRTWTCPTCARSHVRDIEGKLDLRRG
jgi:hypothetical protein